MANNHIYTIQENQVDLIKKLTYMKSPFQYVLLTRNNEWCDIAMWSDKYQNIFLTSRTIDKLSDLTQVR